MKRMGLALTLIMTLLISAVAGTQLANLVSANWFPHPEPEHNIEIKEDGSVMGTDNIRRNGAVYKFIKDVFGNIVVFCDDIVIDGAGHTLQRNGTSTGIFLQGRNNVTIRNLRISNFTVGIDVTWWWPLGWKNTNNIIQGNIITNNVYGIVSDLVGNVTILENTISNNEIGIWCFCLHHLFVSGNNISNNGEGSKIIDCHGNVYHNSFFNNTLQVNCDPESDPSWYYGKISTIVWDDGSKEGNYWSDYNGTDKDGDGIGDTPYIIDANNTDHYPLMNPILVPEFPVVIPEPFPITWIAAAIIAIGVAIILGAAFYRRKRLTSSKTP